MKALFLVLLVGCGSSERGADGGARPIKRGESKARVAPEKSPSPWLEELIAAEDARDLDRLGAHAKSPLVEVRARAIRAVGRVQTAEAIPILVRALGDEAPAVSLEAAFGLGQLGEASTPEVEEALVGKLAAEASREGRAAVLTALGKVGGDRGVPGLIRSMEDPEEVVRVAAAEAFGRYGMRQKTVSAEAVLALVGRIRSDGAPAVRVAACFAFSRIAKFEGEAGTAARRALEGAVTDASPEVRMYAARALASAEPVARPDPLEAAASRDEDWRVRVNAVKSLAKRAKGRAPDVLAAVLTGAVRAFASDRSRWGGTDVHVLAQALELAPDLAPNAALRRALEEVAAAAAPASPPPEAVHALDQLACQAAYALDRFDGRASRVERCGTGAPEWKRVSLAAQVIAKGRGGARVRATKLREMLTKGDLHSRPAILEALAELDDPSARDALVAALEGSDLAEVATAADGIGKQAAKFVRVDPRAAEEASKLGGSAERREAPLHVADPAVTAKLAKALRRMSGPDDVEAALSIVGAIEALKAPDGATVLSELLSHPNAELRSKATKALKTLGATLPSPLPRALAAPNPIEAAEAARLAGLHPRATLRTSRGRVQVELLAAEASGTVLNFIRLAKAGRYRGIVFHRVVPNFVVQGGDPRGDGYGGPGYSIRCEYDPLHYDRGMVGMALAGKDTGGSQFFFTHSPQPHLDGRYTIFGRVTEGMDVVDVLQMGDVIEDVTIEGG